MTPSNTNYQKEAEIALNNLNVIEKGIVNGQLDIYDADDVNQIIDKINACYSVINTTKLCHLQKQRRQSKIHCGKTCHRHQAAFKRV